MAQIKNAYIVYINFDGDIKSKYCWGTWHVFTELEEVKSVVAEALNDLMIHKKHKGRAATIFIDEEHAFPIDVVLRNALLLESYIDNGGSAIGNWEINIYKTEGDWEGQDAE